MVGGSDKKPQGRRGSKKGRRGGGGGGSKDAAGGAGASDGGQQSFPVVSDSRFSSMHSAPVSHVGSVGFLPPAAPLDSIMICDGRLRVEVCLSGCGFSWARACWTWLSAPRRSLSLTSDLCLSVAPRGVALHTILANPFACSRMRLRKGRSFISV